LKERRKERERSYERKKKYKDIIILISYDLLVYLLKENRKYMKERRKERR
jgi:hypothetical protein